MYISLLTSVKAVALVLTFGGNLIAQAYCPCAETTMHVKDINTKSIKSKATPVTKKPTIQIILGSTREGRISDKIAEQLKQMTAERADINLEIVDIKAFNLPFFNDPESPDSRKEIKDPAVKNWSDKILEAQGFVIVFPEYNSGYPGVLKNALDSIYPEWGKKPVGLISYSGGPSGGASARSQLLTIVKKLKMIPVATEIGIPSSWKAFDKTGHLIDEKEIKAKFLAMLDEIKALIKN